MTVGNKIKAARKSAGLTQNQLAEKMMVSRQAITKWEGNKGLPDIENIKRLSHFLNISIDDLLNEDSLVVSNTTKENIRLDDYQPMGKSRCKEDAVVLAKFPDAHAILPLLRQKKLNKIESVIDFLVQPGMLQLADYSKNNTEYYLVDLQEQQLLVNVTKDSITTTKLVEPVSQRTFAIGDNKFTKMPYKLI